MTDSKKAALILLLEGLASSGLQMICIRQTVPFVGSSVVTTSIIISCFLAALALGYYRGGQYGKGQYQLKLSRNLLFSVGFFGIGLSYPFVTFFFESVSKLSTSFFLLGNPLVQIFLFCSLVMCPLVYFLGQTLPLLLNTAKDDASKVTAQTRPLLTKKF